MANEVRINVTSKDRSGPGMRSARQGTDELGQSTKRVGEIAAGILASQVFERLADAAKRAFTSTVAAASNLNESINATRVVFGGAADDVLAIGENSAESMGLSQRAFNEAAVRFSAFAKTIAGDGGNVSQVVQEVTQRSSDFASVMNIDVAKAMELFQSGLAGESEPLRRYGIDVSAAATKTEAYASGIAAAGSELSEAEKIQARYNLIMKQTEDTAGDFANTSDDLANAQRIFGAELEDLQASMGQNMLPVLGQVVSFMTDVLRGFQQLPGPVQTTALVLAGLTAAAAAGAIALRALGVSAELLKRALGPISIALAVGGAILTGLALLGQNSKEASGNVDGLAQTLERGTGAITAATREAVLLELQQKGLADTSRDLGLAVDDVVNAYLGEEAALRRVNAALDQAIEQGTTQETIWKSRKEGISEVVDVQNDEAQAAQRLKDAIADGNLTTAEAVVLAKELGIVTQDAADGGVSELENAAADAAAAVKELRDQLFETGREALELEERQDKLADAVRRVTEVSEDAEATDQDRRAALRDVASASHDLIGTMFDQEKSTDDIAAATQQAREDFLNAADAMGVGQTEAEKLADKYGLIPSDVLTIVTLRDLASEDIGNISDRLDAIDGREARVSIINEIIENRRINTYLATFGSQGMSGQNRAHGGITGALDLGGTVVNERRPEAIDVPSGSRVIPSLDQATDRGQASGGAPLELRVVLELEGAEDAFVEALRGALRVRGEKLGTPA